VTWVGTRFPWTGTAPNTTNIQVHSVHADMTFTGPACPVRGLSWTLTGTPSTGVFDPSSVGANRRLTFNNAHGLTAHANNGTSQEAFVSGAFRDPAGTFNIFD
jgi:hypothetical protein